MENALEKTSKELTEYYNSGKSMKEFHKSRIIGISLGVLMGIGISLYAFYETNRENSKRNEINYQDKDKNYSAFEEYETTFF